MNDKTQISFSLCFWNEANSEFFLWDIDIVQEASKVKDFLDFICMLNDLNIAQ